MQTVTELLSESKRKVVYLVYGFIGVGLGATQTAFTTAEVATPLWLTVALGVYLYIGGAFGLVAAQNVGTKEVVVAGPVGELDYEPRYAEDLVVEVSGPIEDDEEPETIDIDELTETRE